MQRLSEKFWRTFIQMLNEKMAPITTSDEILPFIGTFDEALLTSRLPRPAVVNGTVSGIDLRIGSPNIDPEQAICIPVKYSKATMKARPPSLSKAWKAVMDLQAPSRTDGSTQKMTSSQLAKNLVRQSQTLDVAPTQSDLAAMISAEVKHYSTYVIKRHEAPQKDKNVTQSSQVDFGMAGLDREYVDEPTQGEELDKAADEEEEEEETVAKEDIVKAWRFGSTWVPMERDTFEPLDTRKGVEVLGFFPRDAVSDRKLSKAL